MEAHGNMPIRGDGVGAWGIEHKVGLLFRDYHGIV